MAIGKNGECLAHHSIDEGYRHSSDMLPMVHALLSECQLSISDLNAVAISDGPGSYTGLRVACSTAKALCYTLNIPMIAVPTLQAIASGIDKTTDRSVIMPTVDARRMEVYTALYDHTGNEISPTTNLIYSAESLAEIASDHDTITVCGNGAEKLKELQEELPSNITILPTQCSAAHLCVIAQQHYVDQRYVDTAYHTPYYYKSPNIGKPKPTF